VIAKKLMRAAPGHNKPPSSTGAAFTETENAPGLTGSLVDSVFQRDVSAIRDERAKVLRARALSLFTELVEVYGAEGARETWNAIPPRRTGRGAPAGSRDPNRDRNLIVWVERFAVNHPDLVGRALRVECAKFLDKESPGEFGNGPEAIEKHLDRLLKKRGQKV
jgi:hypothetical protein